LWKHTGIDRVQEEFSFRSAEKKITVTVKQTDGQVCHSGVVWDAALVLCELCALSIIPQILNENGNATLKVLELGSGTGLLSIALAKLFESIRVTATDLPEALPTLSANVARNGVSSVVTVKELAWGSTIEEHFNVIFLADCVFGEFELKRLLATLKSAKKPGFPPVRLIFGYKPRIAGVEKAFFQRLGGIVTHFATPEPYLSTNVQVFQVEL
jgi:2-polyprenyl-3-methyl-5-hydroxy-6-metoxy-1,4-benzoquinol methylase